jgi:phosphoglycolate phosphatase
VKKSANIRLIIFDLDGTLLDTVLDVHNSINYALSEMGLAGIPLTRTRSAVGPGNEEFARIALGEENLHRMREFFSIYRPHYAGNCLENTRPFPGIMELLEKTGNYKRAVATNKPLEGSLPILNRLDLAGFFDAIVGPELVDRVKPAPDMIHYCLDRLGVPASQALVLGDTANDIRAANSAGTVSCLAGWGYAAHSDEITELADYVVGHPDEICGILECRAEV